MASQVDDGDIDGALIEDLILRTCSSVEEETAMSNATSSTPDERNVYRKQEELAWSVYQEQEALAWKMHDEEPNEIHWSTYQEQEALAWRTYKEQEKIAMWNSGLGDDETDSLAQTRRAHRAVRRTTSDRNIVPIPPASKELSLGGNEGMDKVRIYDKQADLKETTQNSEEEAKRCYRRGLEEVENENSKDFSRLSLKLPKRREEKKASPPQSPATASRLASGTCVIGAVAVPGTGVPNRDIEMGSQDGTVEYQDVGEDAPTAGGAVVAEPVLEDNMETEIRQEVRSEMRNELARASIAQPVTPSKKTHCTFWNKRCALVGSGIALLAIIGIVVGVVLGMQESPPDPTFIQGVSSDGERFGDFILLSRDGSTLAAGSDKSSFARIFRRDGNKWKQSGQTLYGDGQFGRTIGLNRNGSLMVIGAWNDDEAGEKAGKAIVFWFNETASLFQQVGQTLLGDASQDRFGYFVTMSDDGRRIAISARNADPSPDRVDAGFVRVYDYNGDVRENNSIWTQVGSDLEGQIADEQFGKRLRMNANGTRLVVSTVRHNEKRGMLRVFDYVMGNWTQTTSTLFGANPSDWFGSALDITPRGDILAVGADGSDAGGNSSGWVGVYELDGNIWKPRGPAIPGEGPSVRLGIRRLSLSDDGRCLAAGGSHYDEQRGKGYLFSWNNMSYVKVGEVVGNYPGDRLGGASAVSGDCTWAAWGANEKDHAEENPDRMGYVRIVNTQDLLNG